jgi:uncharacterized membrane protein (UPF0136 family)
VANSVISPSLGGMFFYPGWLQTSPPLFLVLARAATQVFGLSNAALRTVPLVLTLVGLAAMFAAAQRLLSLPFATLATSLLAFNSTALEYSHTFKQYSGEMAASAMLLWAAVLYLDTRRLGLLLAATALALPLAYSSVFVLPGVLLGVATNSRRNAALLAAVAAAGLAALYLVFARPNISLDLRAFWASSAESTFSWTVAAALAFAAFALARNRSPQYVVCLLPCILLAAASVLGWYPASPRTRLFVLPGFLLILAKYLEELSRGWGRRLAVPAAVAFAAFSGWREVRDRATPFEDVQAAVQYLRDHVQPQDLLLIHASNREGFQLYAAMHGWTAPQPVFGDTGWPCCPRGKDARPGASTPSAVIRDLDSKIPRGFSGRIWLYFTTRPPHWKYTGFDEGDLWRRHIWESGCPPGGYVVFANLAISPMDCKEYR